MKKRTKLLTLLFLLSISGCNNNPSSLNTNISSSLVEFNPEKSEFRIGKESKSLKSQISTLVNDDKSSVTIWVSEDGNIQAQKYNKDFKPEGNEFLLNVSHVGESRFASPQIILDKDKGFIVSWASDNKLFIRKFDKNWHADKPEFTPKYVIEEKSFDVLKPQYGNNSILPNKDGSYYIAGTGSNQSMLRDYGHGYSYIQLYDKDFNPVNERVKFIADPIYPTYGFIDKEGNLLLIFWRFEQSYSQNVLYGQKYKPDLTTVGDSFRIGAKDLNFIQPQIFMDKEDNFIISGYAKNTDNLNYGIYFQKYNLNNQLLFSSEKVDTTKTINDTFPVNFTRSSINNNGDMVITWNGGKQTDSKIYARRYDKNGQPKDKEEFIVNYLSKGSVSNPNVGLNNNGDFLIAWQNYNINEKNYNIYARKYNLNQALPVDDPVLIPKEIVNCKPNNIDFKILLPYMGGLKIKVNDNGKLIELKSKSDYENIAKNIRDEKNPMIIKINGKTYLDTTYDGLTVRLYKPGCFDEAFSKYGIKRNNNIRGFDYISTDYKNAPVADFENLLRKFITKENLETGEMEFSSPKALAAFSLYMDLKLNYSYLFQDLYFSPYFYLANKE